MSRPIWFTADTHFGHVNILKYCDRPFDTIEAHDEALVENWNARVDRGDTVYHLGDFALCAAPIAESLLRRLHGSIQLIRGNHDRKPSGFAVVRDYTEIKRAGQRIVLSHYPFRTWNAMHHGSWQLHASSTISFAKALEISVHTLRNWEQGRRTPEGPAVALLRIAARHPNIIRENLRSAA